MSGALWHVYLLKCADGSLYCGVTNDLHRRVRQHNGELPGGSRCARARRPALLRACLPCHDRSAACRLEAKIKKMPKERKIAFMGGLL